MSAAEERRGLDLSTIHHGGRSGIEVSEKDLLDIRRHGNLLQRVVHQFHPTVARGLINRKGCMPHAKPRVSSPLDIVLRPSKTKNQELAKTLFGARQVPWRVQRSQNGVIGNLPVKCGDQATEAVFSQNGVKFLFFH